MAKNSANAAASPTQKPLSPSPTSLTKTVWACIRLGRLHTLMGWAIFPAPAIYALILFFASHKPQLTQIHSAKTILLLFSDLYWRLLVCVMSYRSAGLAWDDLIDRDYDARVSRTKARPLPNGDVSVDVACAYIAVQSVVTWALGDALLGEQFGRVVLVGVVIFVPYPFLKRWTSLTQFFGAALISVGVLQGWAVFVFSEVVSGEAGGGGSLARGWTGLVEKLMVDWQLLGLLFAAEFAFELAHELVYGNQDTAEDASLGLKSLSIFLGPQRSYQLVVALVPAFVAPFYFACEISELPGSFAIVGAAGCLLCYETFLLDMTKPSSCGRWAKRGIQCKLFLCASLTAAFGIPLVVDLLGLDALDLSQ